MKYITAAEAARRIGVSERTVRMWIKQKKLNAYHVEKNRLAIPEGEVSSMAAERSQYERTYPDVSALTARIEALEQEQAWLKRHSNALDDNVGALEDRISALETREKAERTTLKEKAVSSPVKRDTDQHTAVSAPSGGTIASHSFAELHGINKRTMSDYLAGERFNDRIESEVIGRSGSKLVRGLTPDQQYQAILFFERHGVRYTLCPQCPHEQEQAQAQE